MTGVQGPVERHEPPAAYELERIPHIRDQSYDWAQHKEAIMKISRRQILPLAVALATLSVSGAQGTSAGAATSGNVVYVVGHCWNDSAGNFYSVIDDEFVAPAGLQLFFELGTQ